MEALPAQSKASPLKATYLPFRKFQSVVRTACNLKERVTVMKRPAGVITFLSIQWPSKFDMKCSQECTPSKQFSEKLWSTACNKKKRTWVHKSYLHQIKAPLELKDSRQNETSAAVSNKPGPDAAAKIPVSPRTLNRRFDDVHTCAHMKDKRLPPKDRMPYPRRVGTRFSVLHLAQHTSDVSAS